MIQSGWGQVRATAIAFLFIFSAFAVLLGGGVSPAKATATTISSDPALDGFIRLTFPATYIADSTDPFMFVMNGTGYGYVERSYMSFDTSYLPIGAVIQSAILTLGVQSTGFFGGDFDRVVNLYTSTYGTLDVSDWNNVGTLIGTVLTAYDNGDYGERYSTAITPSVVNVSGITQFCLKMSPESVAVFASWELYTGESAYGPTLAITYTVPGALVHIERTSNRWLNQTAFPLTQEWNLTYDLYEFEIATVPDSINVTIDKQDTTWAFRGVTPACNYTDDPTFLRLEDVFDSITYRVWFTVPKSNPYSTIHIALYNAFTGEGFFWENMRAEMCDGSTWNSSTAQTLAKPDFNVELEHNYTIRILDFFGNMLIDYAFTASAQDIYLTIPVPVYSWQIFNMNDAPILMSIYWNNSGSPWQFFVGPHWIIERFLKGGAYGFTTTFYNSDGTAGSTVYFNRTVPMAGLNASFIYVNGTTLYEIISSVQGVMATQQIITNLISPSVVLIYDNLPLAPVRVRSLTMNTRIALDPYLILEATTYQNQTGIAGTNTPLWLPHAQNPSSSYYIIADTLTFSGTYATNIFINDTSGTTLYSNTVLPAAVILNGENCTVWGDQAYSVSRTTTFREVSEYTVNYYATQRKYETTISLNNTCPFDYHSPYWYISFPANTTIDQNSVTIYDLDNGVTLSQRTNFDVTAGGIHITLTQLNSTNARNFRLTFWDENSTTGIGAPNLIAESYTDGSLNGIPMKYTAVQWTNPWSVSYAGEVYISLNFTNGGDILPSSLVIIDETTGLAIPNQDYVYTGRTILILTSGVGTVPVGGARNYGIYFTLDVVKAPQKTDFLFGPITWNGSQFYLNGWAVSWFIVIIVVLWALVAWFYWTEKDWMIMLLFTASLTIIGFYFSGAMGG